MFLRDGFLGLYCLQESLINKEIFNIILSLKTFHQSHPFSMLGKFHWVFFCISYISAVSLKILTDCLSFRNNILINYLMGVSASIVVKVHVYWFLLASFSKKNFS